MSAIELVDVKKSYGANPVVKGLTLSVKSGEFVSLLGPSGCGKTTTLRMVAGLERTDSGTLTIGETLVDDGGARFVPPERRGLGMVFQSYAVWPHKSVSENVAYPLELQGIGASERERRVKEALGWVRLGAFGDRRPHQLSGGQLQRVAIARALVAGPKVLLFDEPLSNLDVALREELRAEIASLRMRLGTTMVFVTHDQSEALALSDRIAVMHRGVVAQFASPEEIYRAPASAVVAGFVGGSNLLDGEWRDGRFVTDSKDFKLDPDRITGTVPAPGPVTLAVRPEDVVVDPEGTALPLTAKLFLGGSTELRFQLGENGLRRLGGAVDARVGESVPVRFARVVMFSRG